MYNNDMFAAALRMHRAKLNITQAELASKVGIDPTAISQYEQGSRIPGADKVFALAEVLGCSPCDLLGWKA